MNFKSALERHAVRLYFVLVYILTWGGVLLVAQAIASPGGAASPERVGMVALPMLLAPGLAGVTLTALAAGRAGLRDMWARLTLWRVPARWYGVALGVMPVLVLALLGALALLIAPAFAPMVSLFGLAGLAAGYLEEIGWTGFVTPRLLSRWSPLAAGLILGALWGVWHAAADYAIRGATLGAFWPVTFALFVLPVMAWRVLMVWVYTHTKSGWVAQLMHFSYTGSLAFFVPTLAPTAEALVYACLTVALWLGVGLVMLSQRRVAPRQQPQTVPGRLT